MTETEPQESQDGEPELGIVTVTRDDLAAVDLEAPIRDSKKVDCSSLSGLYRAASSQHQQSGSETAARVFGLVSDVARMHFKPEDRAEPYGPMFVMNRRSNIIPSDLHVDQSDVFAAIAADIENPGMRARRSDLAWLNDRKLSAMAQLSVDAYCDAVQAVLDGKAEFSHDSRTASSHDGSEMLHRACQIANATGWKDPEGTRLKSLVQVVTRDASDREDHRGFLNVAERCLQYRVDDPVTLASEAEKLVSTNVPDAFTSRELWELACPRPPTIGKRHGTRPMPCRWCRMPRCTGGRRRRSRDGCGQPPDACHRGTQADDRSGGEHPGQKPGAGCGDLVEMERPAGLLTERTRSHDREHAGAGGGFEHDIAGPDGGGLEGGVGERERRRELLQRDQFLGSPRLRRLQGGEGLQHGEHGGGTAGPGAGLPEHGAAVALEEENQRRLGRLVGVLPEPGALAVARTEGTGHGLVQDWRVERTAGLQDRKQGPGGGQQRGVLGKGCAFR